MALISADGEETLAYAAVHPLATPPPPREAGVHTDRDEGLLDKREGEGGEGVRYALWEFHCVEGSVEVGNVIVVEGGWGGGSMSYHAWP